MAKLFFDGPNCNGVDLGPGRSYNADKSGFIDVGDSGDIKLLKSGGYIQAGAVRPRTGKHWVCDDCGWDAVINSCPRCDSENLRKVEA